MGNTAERVREARHGAELTQDQLADKVGISRSYLAGVELGRYNPSFKVLKKIAAACGVDLNFFQ